MVALKGVEATDQPDGTTLSHRHQVDNTEEKLSFADVPVDDLHFANDAAETAAMASIYWESSAVSRKPVAEECYAWLCFDTSN